MSPGESSKSIAIRHWNFTELDARRTIEVLDRVIDHAVHGRQLGLFDTQRQLAGRLRRRLDAGDDLEVLIHEAWRVIESIRSTLVAADLLPATVSGQVAGIFTSRGGVPKLPVLMAMVDWSGIDGDRQATRRHHGRPWQALCLWSVEVIEELERQGHPIAPGRAGENLAVTGVDWSLVRPGVRLAIGDVLCEVSAYAIPCPKNAGWFRDGSSRHIHHERGPVSRVYATVLSTGQISVGDLVVIEP